MRVRGDPSGETSSTENVGKTRQEQQHDAEPQSATAPHGRREALARAGETQLRIGSKETLAAVGATEEHRRTLPEGSVSTRVGDTPATHATGERDGVGHGIARHRLVPTRRAEQPARSARPFTGIHQEDIADTLHESTTSGDTNCWSRTQRR